MQISLPIVFSHITIHIFIHFLFNTNNLFPSQLSIANPMVQIYSTFSHLFYASYFCSWSYFCFCFLFSCLFSFSPLSTILLYFSTSLSSYNVLLSYSCYAGRNCSTIHLKNPFLKYLHSFQIKQHLF